MNRNISGWKEVKYHELIEHDLDTYPLEIKTDSEIGSGHVINICFYVSSETDVENWRNVGHIKIVFNNPMKHLISPCRNTLTTFDLAVPEETNKIWVITKTSTRLLITCNSVEVVRGGGLMTTFGDFWGPMGTKNHGDSG